MFRTIAASFAVLAIAIAVAVTAGPASAIYGDGYEFADEPPVRERTVEAHNENEDRQDGEGKSCELNMGTRSVFAAAGFTEVSRPSPRRAVMRIDFSVDPGGSGGPREPTAPGGGS